MKLDIEGRSVFGASGAPFDKELLPLASLAGNFYWTWNRKIRSLFVEMDPAAWQGVGENPIAFLQHLGRERLLQLSGNQEFLRELGEAHEAQRSYLHERSNTWFQQSYGILHREYLVAYFSAEFGIASCLKTYSGGLGILSGDHLKSASDLGIPLVGVSLFYRRGYFTQGLTHDGWQTESYPENDPSQLPLEPVYPKDSEQPLIISVHLKGRQVRIRAWRTFVGRVPLYLLDTNLPGHNSKEDCEITAELYGGDTSMRIQQEIILGVGGAKLLHSLGIRPSIFHLNEGHSAFVILERIRQLLEEDESTRGKEQSEWELQKAKKLVSASTLFTTHTPVPAGIDVFPKQLFLEYLGHYASKLGLSEDQLFSMGQEHPNSDSFNMAVLAIRHSEDINAVSKVHRDVARRMWAHMLHEKDAQLASVTNGIHVPSWVSDAMGRLYEEYLGKDWLDNISDADMWKGVFDIPDAQLWQTRCEERKRLVEYLNQSSAARSRLHSKKKEAGLSPNALTVGFARRFATYKRASLILRDKECLTRIMGADSRPVQLLFSGKAHPKDHEGKKLIQEIHQFASGHPNLRNNIIFLHDYDLLTARRMVQGVDLWLNNPRRPMEACGTSGMKVLANGGLNLSVLDGWWDEAFSASRGWAIGGKESLDVVEQDNQDAQALYDALETEVLPDFYEQRDDNEVPTRWVAKMKYSIATLVPRFNTNRMVKEYAQRFYFKDDLFVAGSLNRSELGTESLENIPMPWK